MYNKLCYLCFFSCNLTIYPQNCFSFSIGVEQYERIIGFSRNLILRFHNKLGLFHIVLEEKSQKFSLTIIEPQNLPNLQSLDKDSQISHFEWTLHNGRRNIHIGYRSVTKNVELFEYRRNGSQWKNSQSLQVQREENDKLLDMLPSLQGYEETFKKSCIIIDEWNVENERTEIEWNSKNFWDY